MRRRATTPTDHVPPQPGRCARLVLAAALVACPVLGLGSAPAWAAGNRTVVESIVDDVRPALPPGSQIVAPSLGELAVTSASDVPLTVAAPDGRDFLRISSRG